MGAAAEQTPQPRLTVVVNLHGIGISAISQVGEWYLQNGKDYAVWSEAVRAGRFATYRGYRIDGEDRLRRDVIGRIVVPPGDRGAVAETTGARLHMPAAFAAIEFAAEAAEIAASKLGRPIGLITAMTGDMSRLMWIGYGDSLDHIAADNAKLEADDEFRELYKRSEGLLVDGSSERNMWQLLG